MIINFGIKKNCSESSYSDNAILEVLWEIGLFPLSLILHSSSINAHKIPLPPDKVKISLWFPKWLSYFNTIHKIAQSILDAAQKCKMIQEVYRKIPNISPGLIRHFKHILGAYIRGAYIRGVFCVSICVSRLLNLLVYQGNIDISRQKDYF